MRRSSKDIMAGLLQQADDFLVGHEEDETRQPCPNLTSFGAGKGVILRRCQLSGKSLHESKTHACQNPGVFADTITACGESVSQVEISRRGNYSLKEFKHRRIGFGDRHRTVEESTIGREEIRKKGK
ncbi:hypothetical protein ACFL2C_02745 [Patescibacteria group bacterium]